MTASCQGQWSGQGTGSVLVFVKGLEGLMASLLGPYLGIRAGTCWCEKNMLDMWLLVTRGAVSEQYCLYTVQFGCDFERQCSEECHSRGGRVTVKAAWLTAWITVCLLISRRDQCRAGRVTVIQLHRRVTVIQSHRRATVTSEKNSHTRE